MFLTYTLPFPDGSYYLLKPAIETPEQRVKSAQGQQERHQNNANRAVASNGFYC